MWYQNGELHRDYDLPAVVEENGTKMWYQHGVLHRDQFAAIIAPKYQEYYKNGSLTHGKYKFKKKMILFVWLINFIFHLFLKKCNI